MKISTCNEDWCIIKKWEHKFTQGYRHLCVKFATTLGGPMFELQIDFDYTTVYNDHVKMFNLKFFNTYIELYTYTGLH